MWTKDKLLKLQTKTIKVGADEMIIRKLKAGEVLTNKMSDEDKSMNMISASLVEPALSVEDVRNLDLETSNVLLSEIMIFNGLSGKEPASKN
jgi:hypothetical protein